MHQESFIQTQMLTPAWGQELDTLTCVLSHQSRGVTTEQGVTSERPRGPRYASKGLNIQNTRESRGSQFHSNINASTHWLPLDRGEQLFALNMGER